MKNKCSKKEVELKDIIPQVNGLSSILAMRKAESKIMDLDISKNQKIFQDMIRFDTKDKLFPKQKKK